MIDEVALAERRRERFLRGNEGARRRWPDKLQRAKQAEIEEMRLEGTTRIGYLNEGGLRIAGVALYAGEGSTKHPMGCATVAYGCSRTHRTIMGMVAALLSSVAPNEGAAPSPGEIYPG